MMKALLSLFLLAVVLHINPIFAQDNQSAQTAEDELPRFEVGVHFANLSRPGDGDRAGFGGRITYNINKSVALEAEGNFLPGRRYNDEYFGFDYDGRTSGRVIQGLFGVKAGKRFRRFGVFAKVRPGFITYTDGKQTYEGTLENLRFEAKSSTNFATDVGGVLEIYATKRFFTRFDFGDTIVRFSEQDVNRFAFESKTGLVELRRVTLPSKTRHNFQFSAGIGFRF